MRILYLFNSGNIGGMEKHVVDLTHGMSELGHEVFIWCPSGPIQPLLDYAGGVVYSEQIKWDIDPKYISKLVQFLRLKKIEVIHCHELKAVVNGLIAANIVGTEVKVSHTHTPISEWKIGPLKKSINIFLNTLTIGLSDSMEIALTETRLAVKKKEGLSDKNLVVIPNAIDINELKVTPSQKKKYNDEIRKRYNIPKDAHVIGNISRMTKEKGHQLLVEAYSKIIKDHKNTFLLLAGGGKLKSNIKRQIRDLDIVENCKVTGVFPDEDMPKFYSTFDTFVFPTLAEGFGYVLIEAMYSGVPVLCSDLPVLKEVGRDTVTYFKKSNVTSLNIKLRDMITNKDKYKNLSEEAKERVEKEYSMERFVKDYDTLYKLLFMKYENQQKKLKGKGIRRNK